MQTSLKIWNLYRQLNVTQLCWCAHVPLLDFGSPLVFILREFVRGEASHHGNYSIHIVKRASKAHYFTHQYSSHPRRVRKRVLLECWFSWHIKFQWQVLRTYGILLQKCQPNMEIFCCDGLYDTTFFTKKIDDKKNREKCTIDDADWRRLIHVVNSQFLCSLWWWNQIYLHF